jgi:Skp family chaperone for outer membrane proteins
METKTNTFRQGGRVLKSTIIKSLFVALATVTTILASQSLHAQEGKTGLVAILDVAKVFKENTVFDGKMAAIKTEADRLKAQITQEQETIKNRAQGLTKYEIGSAERNNLEAELEQQQTGLRTKARQLETALLNREALVYYETYEQMQTIVGSLANQYGISLVLRFDSEKIDPNNRADVIKGVNRAVVYHRQLDLTKAVTDAMNARTAQATAGTQNK